MQVLNGEHLFNQFKMAPCLVRMPGLVIGAHHLESHRALVYRPTSVFSVLCYSATRCKLVVELLFSAKAFPTKRMPGFKCN